MTEHSDANSTENPKKTGDETNLNEENKADRDETPVGEDSYTSETHLNTPHEEMDITQAPEDIPELTPIAEGDDQGSEKSIEPSVEVKPIDPLQNEILPEKPESPTDQSSEESGEILAETIGIQNPETAETKRTEDIISDSPASEMAEESLPELNPAPEEEGPKTKAKRGRKPASEKAEQAEDKLLNENDFTDDEEAETHEEAIDFTKLGRDELTLMLEELVKSDGIGSIKAKVAGIKVAFHTLTKEEKKAQFDKFISEGGKSEEYIQPHDSLEERFNKAFEIYKEKKAADDKEQELTKLRNLDLKKSILEKIKNLIGSEESLKKTYDDFKALQDEWKQVGQVPRNEIGELWNNYHFLVEKFFEKVRINKELKDLDLRKNLEQKIQICEKAEELLMEKSITRSFKLLQQYHDEWKEIGPVSQDKKDEIWERFKAVTDKINVQRKDYYEKLHEEQQNNHLAKLAICDKAEQISGLEILSATEWKTHTEEILELQKLWDTIGRAPAKLNDEVWERFRKAVNTFYNNKKEFFAELKDQQMNNYNLKVDLCVQAEALKENNNWKKTTTDILRLQDEWKKVGPVPKRLSDKIWKRFRAACDEFFRKKSEYFSNIHLVEQENLKKKQELIASILNYQMSGDKGSDLESLKGFQREWINIGHVPMDALDKIQGEFRSAINALMDRLKISATEISTMHYKNRIENIQNSPDANRNLGKERMFLEGKINKLRTDIKLWENNIGFLASSKNADLLKAEFEKKINEAKQELAMLEAKLKMLLRPKN